MNYLRDVQRFINFRINGLKGFCSLQSQRGGLSMPSRKNHRYVHIIKLLQESCFTHNRVLGVCYKTTEGDIKLLREYTSCRGFLHDKLEEEMNTLIGANKALTLHRQTSMYLVEFGETKRLSPEACLLVKDFCDTLGYNFLGLSRTSKYCVLELDMNIFKNLYAVSLLFLIFKFPVLAKKVNTLEKFIKIYWYSEEVHTRVVKALRSWNKIFPRKTCTWKGMYGSGVEFSLHNEGMTELLNGKSKFEHVRIRANTILGGVGSCVITRSEYGNPILTVKGAVTNLDFAHRG